MAGTYLIPATPLVDLSAYVSAGGGHGLSTARAIGPDATLDLVHASGLRGRDASALSVSGRWERVIGGGDDAGPRSLVANGTDSEPGSFVDRTLLRRNPFAVIEGMVIAALAIGARDSFLLLRHSFNAEYDLIVKSLAEADVAGWFDSVSVKCVRTPEEYLVGDDRAALEVVEGRTPVPRRLAPHLDGLFSHDHRTDHDLDAVPARPNPTAVESIETLANLPALLANGPSWFRTMGTPVSPGNILCTVTGDVTVHAVAEVELGRRVVAVLEEVGGGFVGDAAPKAVLSGVSSPVLTRSRLSAPLSWEGLAAVGAGVGRAAFMVFAEGTDMIGVAHGVAAFLYVESCGLCPPCKFGGGEVTAHLARLASGAGALRDIEAISARLSAIADGRRCDLASRHRDVVSSILRAFPADVMAAVGPGSQCQPRTISGITDLVEGRAEWDDRQVRKRADWVVEDRPVQLTRW